MKRFTLVLAIMFCFVAAKAQTYVGNLDDGMEGIIPGCFSSTGHPYLLYGFDGTIGVYQSDFTTHLTDIYFGDAWPEEIEFLDLDTFTEGVGIILTQNLFNDDDFFEYFESEKEWFTTYDTVWYWENEYEVYENYYCEITSVSVKSTNGNTVWSYSPGDGGTCRFESLIKFDNRYYFTLSTYDENEGSVYRLYLIKQDQGVTEVEAGIPMSVFPTMPTRDQLITVELGDGNNAKEITVVNGLGQVVKRVPVVEGQREVVIPARELGSGLNVLNTRTNQGHGSCKIIVR